MRLKNGNTIGLDVWEIWAFKLWECPGGVYISAIKTCFFSELCGEKTLTPKEMKPSAFDAEFNGLSNDVRHKLIEQKLLRYFINTEKKLGPPLFFSKSERIVLKLSEIHSTTLITLPTLIS